MADRDEHLPYALAGYVVVAFDIAGALPSEPNAWETAKGMLAFREAAAGLDSASAALDLSLERYSIDERRVYAVGHSSAGTLALLVAAFDSRIKAVVAFAPVTDVVSWFPEELHSALEKGMPGHSAFLRTASPITHADRLARKPVFLFHAKDDSVVPPQETQRLFDAMVDRDVATRLAVVSTGDHYDTMMDEGIPRAIEWLAGLGHRGDD